MAQPTTQTGNQLLTQGSRESLPNKMYGVDSGESNNIERMARRAGEKVSAASTHFVDSASEYVRSGRHYVQENPEKGVAYAVAAGAIVGSLVTLAMRRRK